MNKPTAVKWSIGIMCVLCIMSILGAIGTFSSEIENGNSPLYNASGQIITALLSATCAIGLWLAYSWAKWLSVALFVVQIILSLISSILLYLKDPAFIGFPIQAALIGAPILYLAYKLGWGIPAKTYFMNTENT